MSIRLLVDAGNYFSDNDNHGDRAIYQSIVARLRHIWPECEIRWITRNAELLRATCPDVSPIELTEDRLQLGRSPAPSPWRLWSTLTPLHRSRCQKVRQAVEREKVLRAVRSSDVVLATGGGYFSDSFAEHAQLILDTLEAGARAGKPTVILSCGFEPIRNASVREKMLTVLPQVSLIICREPLQSPNVVRSFGVEAQRVIVSGDEAVERAFSVRPVVLGDGLGINLRQAEYAGVDVGTVERLRETVHRVADRLAAPVISVPISMHGPSDPDAIRELLTGFAGYTDDGGGLTVPEDVMRQAGRCRLVITGSYHAAVFALSQGVSVVALVASPHYRAKMHGLRSSFGTGCHIVPLYRDDTNEALATAIEKRWQEADVVREELLQSALRQIAATRASYERVRSLVETSQRSGRRRVQTKTAAVPLASVDQAAPAGSVTNLLPNTTGASHMTDAKKPSVFPAAIQRPSGFVLSPAEIETFRTQGFVGPFTAFEAHEMERFRRIIDSRVLTTPTPYCPFGLRVRHLDSRTVFELCSAPPIVGRMTSLYGPNLVLWNSNLFNKPPAELDRPEEYPWHQDHYNWNIEPVVNVSAWLAIGPATVENGCVEVIPGSHRQIIPAVRDTDPRLSLRFGGVASDPAFVDETKKVALPLEPGQFFLFNERLLHHSNPNRTSENRLGLAIRATLPFVKVSEPFPCIMLSGEDDVGFNRYVDPPPNEPDTEWLAALPQGSDFAFDRPIPGMGWHMRETDGRHHFAWTGLEPEAWIDFGCVESGDHVLVFEVIHTLSPTAVDALRVCVNGHHVKLERRRTDDVIILEARVPDSALRAWGDRVRISLKGPELLRPCDLNPASQDKRELGLGIRRISLTPCEDQRVMPQPTA